MEFKTHPIKRDMMEKTYFGGDPYEALFDLNDQLKLYLAFKQIPTGKFYESNCNLFSETAMEPFTSSTSCEIKIPLSTRSF